MGKIKEIYRKMTPAAKAVRIVMIVFLIAWLVSTYLVGTLTDPWHVFYSLWAQRITMILAIVAAVIYIVLDLVPLWRWLAETCRKAVVSLKRNPSIIPLLMLLVSFLVYSLNLTHVSDTTAKIQGTGMGLSQFCIMLFSLLSMVCMLNAFPRHKKPNIPMIVLMFAMFAVIIYCDIHYSNAVMAAINRAESPIVITEYIENAYNMLGVHMPLVGVTAALVALLPLYSKLLRMINTSVAVEDTGDLGAIEISD